MNENNEENDELDVGIDTCEKELEKIELNTKNELKEELESNVSRIDMKSAQFLHETPSSNLNGLFSQISLRSKSIYGFSRENLNIFDFKI